MPTSPRGVPPLGAALIRPTRPDPDAPDPAEEPTDAEPADQDGAQGRGGADPAPAARARRRRVDKPSGKTDKHGLYLTNAVWERLQLEAIRKKTTASVVAGDILERNLPKLRIERD
jgi:hypothetical protein